jgi:hypothetical protein
LLNAIWGSDKKLDGSEKLQEYSLCLPRNAFKCPRRRTEACTPKNVFGICPNFRPKVRTYTLTNFPNSFTIGVWNPM